MKNQNSPETIKIQDQNFGNHVEHWNLLTDTPEVDVPKWLGLALDAPVMPMGLCEDEQDMDQSFWLIQGPSGQKVCINQIIAVEDQKPRALKTAFPSFESPYRYDAKIERIITCDSATHDRIPPFHVLLCNCMDCYNSL